MKDELCGGPSRFDNYCISIEGGPRCQYQLKTIEEMKKRDLCALCQAYL